MEAMMADAARADRGRERRRAERRRREAKSKAAFGTMRRGFLNGPGPAKTKKKTQEKEKKREKREDEVAGSGGGQSSLFELDGEGNLVECGEEEVPTLRPKAGGAGKADRLRLREVQEAMRDASLERLAAATAGEWADDSLMDRVAQNPRLAAGMRNPKFAAALLALQKDPRVAMARFANHPEIGDFLREFCGVMGQHFTELGEAQQKQKQKQKQKQQRGTGKGTSAGGNKAEVRRDIGPLVEAALKKTEAQVGRDSGSGADDDPSPPMSQAERAQLDSVLADPELTRILMDPRMQAVMQECSKPGRMAMFMQSPEHGPKLRRLLRAGLLQMV